MSGIRGGRIRRKDAKDAKKRIWKNFVLGISIPLGAGTRALSPKNKSGGSQFHSLCRCGGQRSLLAGVEIASQSLLRN
jgi:hypothetical protein